MRRAVDQLSQYSWGVAAARQWAERSIEAATRTMAAVWTGEGAPAPRSSSNFSEPRLASEHLQGDALAQAIEHLRHTTSACPDDAGGWSELGHLLLGAHRFPEAVDALERARVLDPTSPWIPLRVGVAYVRLGLEDLAEERFRQALALRPRFYDATIELGRLLRQQGRLVDAIELLEPVAKRPRERRARALAELGRAYLLQERLADADVAFAHAVEREPRDIHIRLCIANGLANVGTKPFLDQAAQLLDSALLMVPEHAPLCSALGSVQERLGRLGRARRAYERALEQDPAYSHCRRRLVRLLSEVGEPEEAYHHVMVLLDQECEDSSAFFLAGLVADRLQRPHEALEHYERAVSLAGGRYPEALLNIGAILRRLGELDGAIDVYETALEQRPKYASARNNLALALADAGRLDAAVQTLRDLVFDEPDDARAWYNLGCTLGRAEEHAQALVALERCVALDPKNWSAVQSLAASQRRAGRVEAALRTVDRLLEHQPMLASGWYNRGIALEAADDAQAAARSYLRAVRFDPEHEGACRRLAHLTCTGVYAMDDEPQR